ncbi:uncharacterized protein LOC128221473 [Mya arenaria]|uniref:uncharacterized protein LOC128221473 n=1 Tax=Mya arenaria TaxID=6604 RepID=UPI0022E3A0F3|nr:uncharacterized protein LOC128221473 [Mya arenaria]
MALTLPGFSAVGFVLKPDRFTKELIATVEAFNAFFGNNVQQYAFIILTHTNCEMSKDEYLQDGHAYLDKLRNLYAGNVVFIDNKCDDSTKEKHVGRIIEEIERITQTNNNTPFSNEFIKVANKLAINSEKKDFEEMSNKERQQALESFKTKVENREANVWNNFMAGMRRNSHYAAGVGAATTLIAFRAGCTIM